MNVLPNVSFSKPDKKEHIVLFNSKFNSNLNKKIKNLGEKTVRPMLQENLQIQYNDQVNIRSLLNNIVFFDAQMNNDQHQTYLFNPLNKKPLVHINKLITLAFLAMGCLISKPKFTWIYLKPKKKQNKNKSALCISLFYYKKVSKLINFNFYNSLQLKLLTYYISNLLKTKVIFNLRRVNKPVDDAHILIQEIKLFSYKTSFFNFASKLFKKANFQLPRLTNNTTGKLTSSLSGMFIRGAGRMFRYKIIPRKTVKELQRGILSHVNIVFKQKSQIIGKTKRGSYCFTVKISHIFI